MSKKLSCKAMSLMAVSHTAHDAISWNALWDYIAELEAAQRWIPVSERLPDTKIVYDEFDVIVELGDIESGEMIRRVDLLSYDYRNKSWNDDCGEFGFYPVTGVTHWRERPTPPEVQE